MNNQTPKVQSKGMGFMSCLALIFITLKLVGAISWSWWWVLAPIWGPVVLVALFLVVGSIIVAFDK